MPLLEPKKEKKRKRNKEKKRKGVRNKMDNNWVLRKTNWGKVKKSSYLVYKEMQDLIIFSSKKSPDK